MKKVAIIGAGLIGCEFANDLILSDYDVSVIGLEDLPLDRLLPQQAANYVKEALANEGINWHLGEKTTGINFADSVFNIALENGNSVDADVVLSSACSAWFSCRAWSNNRYTDWYFPRFLSTLRYSRATTWRQFLP